MTVKYFVNVFLKVASKTTQIASESSKKVSNAKISHMIVKAHCEIYGRICHFQMVGQPAKLLLKINTKVLQASVIGWILFGQVLQPKMSES